MAEIFGIMGCGKTKADVAKPARELYTGAYTRKRRDVLELTCSEYRILSAKHGLLHPEERVEPYNLRVDSPEVDTEAWGAEVRAELQEIDALQDPDSRVITLLGRAYLEPIEPALQAAPAHHVNPFRYTSGMGEQNGLLTSWRELLREVAERGV